MKDLIGYIRGKIKYYESITTGEMCDREYYLGMVTAYKDLLDMILQLENANSNTK